MINTASRKRSTLSPIYKMILFLFIFVFVVEPIITNPYIVSTDQPIPTTPIKQVKEYADIASYEAHCLDMYSGDDNKDLVEAYCTEFEAVAKTILQDYGWENPKVVLTLNGELCGEKNEAVACVYQGYPVIYIDPLEFPYALEKRGNFRNLKSTLAHEYIHVLTSNEEHEYLATLDEQFANEADLPASEIVADCGIQYFVEDYLTYYVKPSGCNGAWEDYSKKVIENNLV